MPYVATASLNASIPDIVGVYAGALDIFSINCAGILGVGETIANVVAGVDVWALSPIADPLASELLRGSPSVAGTSVSAWLGGISTTTNFVAGAVYTLWFQLTTSLGRTPIVAANVSVSAAAPPTLGSGASLPATEFAVTTNMTASAPGNYFLQAAGVTFTLLGAGVGGDIVLIDETGAPACTIAGTVVNAPSGLSFSTGYFSHIFRWSAKYSGWIVI